MKNYKKKAQVETHFFIKLVVALVSVAIIFLFYSLLDFGRTSQKDLCHQSVILRATMPGNFIPLNCNTEKICVGGGNFFRKGICEVFDRSEKVNYIRAKEKQDIEKVIADSVLDCWEMMGQGKISLFTPSTINKFGFGDISSNIIICSRISFDQETLGEEIDFSEINVLDYMLRNRIPGRNETYASFFSEKESGSSITFNFDEFSNKIKENEDITEEFFFDDQEAEQFIENPELAVIFMQVKAPTTDDVYKNLLLYLGGGTGAVMATHPVGSFKIIKSAGTFCAAVPWACLVAATVVSFVGGAQYSNIQRNLGVAATYCSGTSIDGKEYGECSMVRVINYDAESISQFCSVIESIA